MLELGMFALMRLVAREAELEMRIGSNAPGPGPIFYSDGAVGYCALVRHPNQLGAHWIVKEIRQPRRKEFKIH